MLTGLLAPTSGQVSFFGEEFSENMTSIRRQLGVCPQFDILFPALTVQEHLEFYGALKGSKRLCENFFVRFRI